MSLDLSIVTISTNQEKLLKACLTSIYGNKHEVGYEVIVVDNVSSDGTSELVRTQFPQAILVVNQTKLGFAANNNKGIRVGKGRYLLILNPDMEVLPGSLDELVAFMDGHPEAGIAGSKLLNSDLSLQYSCRMFSTVPVVLLRILRIDMFFSNHRLIEKYLMSDWDHSEIRSVDWILGACMIVRREAMDEVGMMDEDFFLYFEDQDWCYRMCRKRWNVFYVPSAQMIHHHQRASARGLFSKYNRAHMRSMIRFFLKRL